MHYSFLFVTFNKSIFSLSRIKLLSFFFKRSGKLDSKSYLVGVISDTHGLLRPEAEKYLKGSDLIIHAGDIGSVEIVNKLKKLAPVKTIRGNIDKDKWTEEFPETLDLKIRNIRLFVIHNIKDLEFNHEKKKYDLIISGHSHKPSIKEENGVIFLNPGSAGKRRFNLPISIAKLKIKENKISAKIIELNV